MKKFYKLKNDAVFKAVFCKEKNKDLFELLLQEALNKKINIISINTPEIYKNNVYEKGRTLDVLIKSDNLLINVEINTFVSNSLKRRNAGYIFRKYSELTHMGESYNSMPLVIQINLSSLNSNKLVYKYNLYDKINNKTYIDNLEIYEFNITKIKETCYNKSSKYRLLSLLDCNKEELDLIKGDDIVERIKNEVNYLNDDPDFIKYMSEEDEARLLKNTLKEDAYQTGIHEGFEKGVEHGIEQGIEEGSKKQKLITAKELLKNNIPIDIIVKSTGLTEEEINSI